MAYTKKGQTGILDETKEWILYAIIGAIAIISIGLIVLKMIP